MSTYGKQWNGNQEQERVFNTAPVVLPEPVIVAAVPAPVVETVSQESAANTAEAKLDRLREQYRKIMFHEMALPCDFKTFKLASSKQRKKWLRERGIF